MKRTESIMMMLALLMCGVFNAKGEMPSGYYNSCEGKKGAALLSALRAVVGPHTTVSYDGLWDIYPETDSDPDGKLWDMYSTKRWTWGNRPCGNYSKVGDCYNREHSFPKSWFNEGSPMKSDAFHVYPTDGKVNGQRSNFPYGECANGASVASNGNVRALGKLGESTFPGYSGKVFEPDDEYKGDFARTYFYMAAAYNDKIAGWDSPQLAGNSYPAFSDWSVEMLMKWHRQDPVSQKEMDRNEAVYKYQHNRNPFIDYPDMAEHIWGNKKESGWNSSTSADPVYVLPAEGITVDVGVIGAGASRYYAINVRGNGFTQTSTVSVSGAAFQRVYPSTLTAQAVNNGTTVTVVASSQTAGTYTGTLTIASGSVSRQVALKVTVMDGLPALEATQITEDSFVARWADVDNGNEIYKLHVQCDGMEIDGYPVELLSDIEEYCVDGLQPGTTYTYFLESPTLVSNTVTVTTAAVVPDINLIYEGELFLTTVEGQPSEVVEIGLETDNISGDIAVSVQWPFELSVDKSGWGTSLTLSTDDASFYLRLNGEEQGIYTSSIVIEADGYLFDDDVVSGSVGSVEALCETFESGNWKNAYTAGTYEGVAGTWKCKDLGVYQSDSKMAYEGNGCARFGKSASSEFEMDFDRPGGIGTVSFMAHVWPNDPAAVVCVEYSTDGGETWEEAATIDIPESGDYSAYSASVNKEGNVRIRLRQTAGSRVLVDNLSATAYTASSLNTITATGRAWDAYCDHGRLVIEAYRAAEFAVYSIDARCVYSSEVSGTTSVTLPAGFYIVVSGDDSKKVSIKK